VLVGLLGLQTIETRRLRGRGRMRIGARELTTIAGISEQGRWREAALRAEVPEQRLRKILLCIFCEVVLEIHCEYSTEERSSNESVHGSRFECSGTK